MKRIGLVVGIVAGLVAIGVWFAGVIAPKSDPRAPMTEGRSSQEASPSVSNPTGSPDAASRCRDAGGLPTDCGSKVEWIVLHASDCSEVGGARSLGVGAGERQLSLRVAKVDALCLGQPGAPAKAAGAVATDLLKLESGETVSRLSLCAVDFEASPVACSEPHVLEFVDGWSRGSADTNAGQRCADLARRFLQREADPLGGEISVQTSMRTQQGSVAEYRCALKSKNTLYGSLWHIGGDPLPR